MLRVTVNKTDTVETWELEGKLAGEWVKELESCWRKRTPQAGITMQVHLKAVSYIDASGKKLLEQMHGSGVEIKGCGCMARALVEEIVRMVRGKDPGGSTKKILIPVLFGVWLLGGVASCVASGEGAPMGHQARSATPGLIGAASNLGDK